MIPANGQSHIVLGSRSTHLLTKLLHGVEKGAQIFHFWMRQFRWQGVQLQITIVMHFKSILVQQFDKAVLSHCTRS